MYFKRAFLDFPKLIGLCLAAGLFAGLVLFIASKIYSDDAGKINAAYVIDEEDDSFRSAIKYLTQSANCKLKPSSEDKAMSDLYNKKVAAALLINNRDENGNTLNTYDSAIKFIYPESEEFISSIFGDMIYAGLSDYIVIRNSARTVKQLYPDCDEESVDTLKDDLMDILIERNRNYERITYTDTGDVPLTTFYDGSALCLIILLSSGVLIGLLKRNDRLFLMSVKTKNITRLDIFMARYIPIIGLYLLINIIFSIVYEVLFIGEFYVIGLLSAQLAALSFIMSIVLIHELISDNTLGMVACMGFTILQMFLGGCIIPASYLPDFINEAGDYLASKWGARAYGQLLFGMESRQTLISLSLINLFILLFTGILPALRKENIADENL